jgi:succinoglycan biosynthesis protein ExoM
VTRDVSILVCTFRRNALLGACLDSLRAQTSARVAEVIVVDNDAARAAEPVVAARVAAFARIGVALVYRCEPRRGIAHARNCAVAAARGAIVALLDDDEQAAPDWIAELTAPLADPRVDGVLGPVRPRFGPAFPPWLAASALFARAELCDGVSVPPAECRAGNVALRRARLDGRAGPFRPQAGRMGEDSELLAWLIARGGVLVWRARAVVTEEQEAERRRWRWHLRRGFDSGRGWARQRCEQHGARGRLAVAASLATGSVRLWARAAAQARNPRGALLFLARGTAAQLGKLAQLVA